MQSAISENIGEMLEWLKRHAIGEMLEWLKRHAWKACVPQKGIASSNLALSAKIWKAALRASAGLFWYVQRNNLTLSLSI